jgi:hypothetical protein
LLGRAGKRLFIALFDGDSSDLVMDFDRALTISEIGMGTPTGNDERAGSITYEYWIDLDQKTNQYLWM